MLCMLSSKPKLPWCCFADFNELLEVQDKRSGVPWNHNLMQMFRDVLDHYDFVDLGYSGPDYTWHGRRRGELIWQRLDCGVAKYEWLTKFPTGRVRHLKYFTSSHLPILLSLDVNGEHQKWRRKPFRFEAMRVTNFGCRNIIIKAWDCTPNGTPMFVATKKLKSVRGCWKLGVRIIWVICRKI